MFWIIVVFEIILCKESNARIPEACKRFIGPDSGNECGVLTRKSKKFIFSHWKHLSGGNFMRGIDCAHFLRMGKLSWPWFREWSWCIDAKIGPKNLKNAFFYSHCIIYLEGKIEFPSFFSPKISKIVNFFIKIYHFSTKIINFQSFFHQKRSKLSIFSIKNHHFSPKIVYSHRKFLKKSTLKKLFCGGRKKL